MIKVEFIISIGSEKRSKTLRTERMIPVVPVEGSTVVLGSDAMSQFTTDSKPPTYILVEGSEYKVEVQLKSRRYYADEKLDEVLARYAKDSWKICEE